MSVSFSGELAYEIHVPNASLFAAYSALMQAGAAHDIGHFGARAVDSMRMEKGYLHWKSDLITEFDPYETGLNRFVCQDKDFLGKSGLVARGGKKRRQLRMLEIDATHASPQASDSLYAGGELVGSVTSAEWGHRTGKNIAYAFLQPDIIEGLTVDIIGTPYTARVLNGPVYDPDNSRVKT
jgi:dimethylglycine dehydrogenase